MRTNNKHKGIKTPRPKLCPQFCSGCDGIDLCDESPLSTKLKIYQPTTKEGVALERYSTTKQRVETFYLSWSEFWKIARYASRLDVESDIKEYLDDIGQDYKGIERIIQKVMKIKIAKESTDDICEALIAIKEEDQHGK